MIMLSCVLNLWIRELSCASKEIRRTQIYIKNFYRNMHEVITSYGQYKDLDLLIMCNVQHFMMTKPLGT